MQKQNRGGGGWGMKEDGGMGGGDCTLVKRPVKDHPDERQPLFLIYNHFFHNFNYFE